MEIDIEELITQVRLRPDLYDPGAAHYRDRERKRALWKEVCDALHPGLDSWGLHLKNVYGREVQKKWNSLRDCFRRELNQQLRSQGEGRRRTQYRYYDRLLFLAPFSQATAGAEDGSGRLQQQSLASEAEFLQDRLNCSRNDSADDEAPSSKRKKQDRVGMNEEDIAKKMKNGGVEQMLTALKESNKMINEIRTAQKNQTLDDDEAFLMSLRPSFKNLTIEEKFALRIELMQTIVKFKQVSGEQETVTIDIKTETDLEEVVFEDDNPLSD